MIKKRGRKTNRINKEPSENANIAANNPQKQEDDEQAMGEEMAKCSKVNRKNKNVQKECIAGCKRKSNKGISENEMLAKKQKFESLQKTALKVIEEKRKTSKTMNKQLSSSFLERETQTVSLDSINMKFDLRESSKVSLLELPQITIDSPNTEHHDVEVVEVPSKRIKRSKEEFKKPIKPRRIKRKGNPKENEIGERPSSGIEARRKRNSTSLVLESKKMEFKNEEIIELDNESNLIEKEILPRVIHQIAKGVPKNEMSREDLLQVCEFYGEKKNGPNAMLIGRVKRVLESGKRK